MEAAVEDINSNPSVLGGTKLNVISLDSNSSGFLGIVEGKPFCNIYYILLVFVYLDFHSFSNCLILFEFYVNHFIFI